MASFKWVGGSVGAGQGRYQVAADWNDLTTGALGDAAPGSGDTATISGVANSGIERLGDSYIFPIGGGYTLVEFFDMQDPNGLLTMPGSQIGYTLQSQTITLDGTAGVADIWLQNSQILNSTINVVGTAQASFYLNDAISGAINVGTAAATGYFIADLIPADTAGAGPSSPIPVNTLDANITVGTGSTLFVDASTPNAPDGLINNGAITVAPGGTLVLDDTDNPDAATFAGSLPFASSNDFLFANGGTVTLEGAAGQTTTAIILADTQGPASPSQGPGAINVIGNGAAMGATTLTIDGFMTNENLTLNDATIVVNDASAAIDSPDPSQPDFAISGGSLTFAGPGELVLHQAPLTTLAFNSTDTGMVQTPDGYMPFTTPISGFGTGDTIALPGKDLAGFGLATCDLAYDPGSGLLQVEQPASLAGNPPEIIAALTFVGTYSAGNFVLSGNSNTEELEVTYGVACYADGTLITTGGGECPVEELKEGDLVLTLGGGMKPVRWIGRRRYGERQLRAWPQLRPILFEAGSLGGGLPRRRLRVSPDHAMYLDGLLIPARALVNGVGIRMDPSCRAVEYRHIELDAHDIILAEGAASETFTDDASAWTFENAAARAGTTGDPAVRSAAAPRVEHGYEVEAIRRALARAARPALAA